MKPVLAVVAVALGVVAFILNGKIAGLESENSALRAELAAMRAENQISANIRKKAEDEAASAAENAKRLAAERDAALARSAESPAPPTVAAVEKPPAAAADLTKGFAEMFKGEEGKQMLKMQAEMGTRLMYGDFIKKLDPSTSDAVMALLAERQGKMTSPAWKP